MSCFVVLCSVVLRFVALCCIALCVVRLRCVVLRCGVCGCLVLCHVVFYCDVLRVCFGRFALRGVALRFVVPC